MNITILAYLEPDDEKPDVVVEHVARALESRGHKTAVLTIRDDVTVMATPDEASAESDARDAVAQLRVGNELEVGYGGFYECRR